MTRLGRVRLLLWLPLILFLIVVGVVASGLLHPSSPIIRSRMIGEPIPAFALPTATADRPALASTDLRGKPRLLNIFASWCVPCAAEAPQLMQLAELGVPIDAIAIRNRREDLEQFLAQRGNPFQRIGSDMNSSVQLALGSSGVPETFVIDSRGIIRYQHVGDIRPEDVPTILSALAAAK